MGPYRNQIPHSVAAQTKVYASDTVSVMELEMTTPEATEFDSMCFVVVERQGVRLVVEKRRIDLEPGIFVPVNPGQPGGSDAFRRVQGTYFISVDQALAEEIWQMLFSRRASVVPNRAVELGAEIPKLLGVFIAEASGGCLASSLLLSSCATALAGCLIRDAVCRLVGIEQKTVRHPSVRAAIEYLRANVEADCRLSQVAEAASLSPFHLIRAFKSATGETPHDYLVGLRIAKAKELLADRRFSIAEIANRCGFREPGSLSHVFRRKVGASPTA